MEDTKEQLSIKRCITGFIFGIIAFACIVFGSFALLALLAIVIIIASKEYVQILRMKGFHPSFSVIVAVGLLLCVAVAINRIDLLPSILVLGTIASFLIVLFMGRQPYIANVATTALGFMYGALLPVHIILLRQISNNTTLYGLDEGAFLAMVVFFCVLVTDTAAYFGGKRFGAHKLSYVISPKKTVEGAVIGGVCAILIALPWTYCTGLSLIQCAIGGLIITVAAQLGDLSESLIKRDAGVKDSSNILPGHGGFLDRSDSYIFALPVAYYYFLGCINGNTFFSELWQSLMSFINVSI